jgi:hypothetical protein
MPPSSGFFFRAVVIHLPDYTLQFSRIAGYKVEKNDRGGVCSTYGEAERRAQDFGGEN